MANCVIHPGTTSVLSLYGKNYCAKCKKEIEAARKAVDRHVEPKDCFLWYADSKRGWQPIDGTGCAHWVAHEQGIRKGTRDTQCLMGYPFRVSDTIAGRKEVKLEDVAVDDLYVTTDKQHMGIVRSVA